MGMLKKFTALIVLNRNIKFYTLMLVSPVSVFRFQVRNVSSVPALYFFTVPKVPFARCVVVSFFLFQACPFHSSDSPKNVLTGCSIFRSFSFDYAMSFSVAFYIHPGTRNVLFSNFTISFVFPRYPFCGITPVVSFYFSEMSSFS